MIGFKLKRTVASVAHELHDGLLDGSIRLSPTEGSDAETVQWEHATAVAKARAESEAAAKARAECALRLEEK